MNKRTVWSVVDFIRRQGELPRDQFGQILPVDDLMAWFGLNEQLSVEESRQVKLELMAMAEAQQILDELEMTRRLRAGDQA